MHFGKGDLEGHLGFAVAQEMRGGMVCSGSLDCIGHSLSQDTCFYIGTEIVLMSEKLAWGKWEGKWKNIYHLEERLAEDEQGPVGRDSICIAFHMGYSPSFIHPTNIYLACTIGRSCSRSVGASKEQSGQKRTLWR